MPLILSIMLPFFGFSNMSRAHFIMVSTTPLDLLSSFMLIQMRTRLVIQLINAPSQVFVSCWVLFLSRGMARRGMWFLIPILRLSIMPFASSWLTWMLYSLLSFHFIVTIVVLSALLITMFSMNAQSILRSIATSLAIILRKTISSCSPSSLLTSLLISSPRLARMVVFEILYPNSS